MLKRKTPPIDVYLSGRRIADNDNLSIGYLEAALISADIGVAHGFINSPADVAAVGDDIIRCRPAIVGISLSDGASAMLILALGEYLFRHQFKGHITAGGPFATLARVWLLQRYPWLCSVVRFAGEVPIVALTQCIRNGGDWTRLPGITTRGSIEIPAPLTDETPMQLVPHRQEMNRIIDFKSAQMCATRGCTGRCAYCGPAALQNLEYLEGKSLGMNADTLRTCGVGGVKRRSAEHICDEISLLWHQKKVRYFYFVDEHMLPEKEDDALMFIQALVQGLKTRKVGAFGIGTMLRPQYLTRKIIDAFAALGLVRCFVGIELASRSEGRRYGRIIDHAHTLNMLRYLGQKGVATISNLMLVHPFATLESIQTGISLLSQIPCGLFEGSRMAVYHGTHLHKRLAAQNILTGNPFRYDYVIADDTARRFRDIFARLRGESFQDYAVSYRAHDLELAIRLKQKLAPDTVKVTVLNRYRGLQIDINALYVSAYATALKAAQQDWESPAINKFITNTRQKAAALHTAIERLSEEFLTASGRTDSLFSPMRHAAAAAFAFVMAGAAQSGCHDAGSEGEDTLTATASDSDAGRDSDSDSGIDVDSDTAVNTDTGTCGESILAKETALLELAVAKEDVCYSGQFRASTVNNEWQFYKEIEYSISIQAGVGKIYRDCENLGGSEGTTITVPLAETPCLTSTLSVSDSVSVKGGVTDELAAIDGAVAPCAEIGSVNYEIHVDESGKVQIVTVKYSLTSRDKEVADCLQSVLADLTFPCIAGYAICPEYIIAE